MQGSYERWDAARSDFNELVIRLDVLVCDQIAGMIVEDQNKPWNIIVQLPSPSSLLFLPGRASVLAGRIVEGLLSALDMAVVHMARTNSPDLDERRLKFLISDDRESFYRRARFALMHCRPR